MENIKEFLAAAQDFAENFRKEYDRKATLTDFLQNISLFTTLESEYENLADDGNDSQKVNLITLHNAKGMEFDTVFITGLEEKLLPHQLSLNSSEEIEEERRLLYVGMTRAKSNLYLSYATHRRTYYGYDATMPSRFLRDIYPDQLKQRRGYPADTYGTQISRSRERREAEKRVSNIESHFRIGQKIRHEEFGEGKILGVEGTGNNAKLSILFRDGKLKKIIGSYVEILTEI